MANEKKRILIQLDSDVHPSVFDRVVASVRSTVAVRRPAFRTPPTGAITNALIEHGVDQKRLVLVEYNPGFCALLRDRYPQARVVQGDAYALRESLGDALDAPASAVVSGLPLVTKPMLMRLKLIRDAFVALAPGAPFVQFTYSVAPPIPKSLPGVSTEASERIWMNLPPGRVWVYRKG